MIRPPLPFLRVAALACSCLTGAAAAAEPPVLTRCRLADAGERTLVPAECGTLTVPLDPSAPDGEKIDLRVAKIPALSDRAATTALTVIAGGPGQASTGFYAGYSPAFERVREHFDIILVDQRGTGASNRLSCPPPEQSLGDEWTMEKSVDIARDCLAGLDADTVGFYTTSVAVRDLDRLREAFGYEQLSVYGVSYGTRVAQHYLRRFPERTHSVILDGVVPVDLALGPDIAPQAQRALDFAFERCTEAAACRKAYPTLRADFRGLADTLTGEPVAVTLNDPLTAEVTEVKLGYFDLAGAIRVLSYSPETVALLPLYISHAAAGNYQPITAEALSVSRTLVDAFALGMHNSVVCAEDAPFFADVDTDALDETYLGSLLYEGIASTCSVWPRGVIDDDFKTTFSSDVPALVLSGEADPITPPAYGERVVEYLGNARHIIGTAQGHGMAGVGCMPRLLGEFVSNRSFDTLDTSCLDKHDGEPFFTSFTGPEP